ncbi:MAG: wax ester/triacylglycerol synthase family O-acyltransferase [Myxococcota bacterium]|jgi:WS/DGAT/MGAT family acyltransferase|nr:wax ester/triacylglycerol synthase family O-acyltransferase [Myxococcota bacterium]
MAYASYERLTALDSTFLDLESPSVHMHVGSIGILDPGPLVDETGTIDFDQILNVVDSAMRRIPRLCQTLVRTPVTQHPVWVDDKHFNVLYHVRQTSLPRPGDERQLKRLAGRIMSEKLDEKKPLWEMWFVEGLEGGKVAIISKIHHCLIDGISGIDILAAFLDKDADVRHLPDDHRWLPRSAPTPLRLLTDEVQRRASIPGKLASKFTEALRRPKSTIDDGSHLAAGLFRTLRKSFTSGSETPFNVPIGPHRRFDWTRFDLDIVREVRTRMGGTINDVALACVAGAVRRYFERHEIETRELDFRAFLPVSTRKESERGRLGNHVSLLVAPLPVGEPDARKRVERVIEETRELKHSGEAEGTDLLEQVSDWTVPALLSAMSRMAATQRAFNLVVTNVPGPPFPVYLSGARMLATYPVVPLFENQALGIALMSYDGALFWGFNSDWDVVPDLHDFVNDIEQEFELLRKL